MTRYCPLCGRSIPVDARICPYCGKSIALHEGMILQEPEQKKDKTVFIIVAVVAILIIVPVAIAATVYVYITNMISQPAFYTPVINLIQNNTMHTLTVESIGSSTVKWSFINVQGNCIIAGHGLYVKAGDSITNCTGIIRIIYIPTNSLVGSWNFV